MTLLNACEPVINTLRNHVWIYIHRSQAYPDESSCSLKRCVTVLNAMEEGRCYFTDSRASESLMHTMRVQSPELIKTLWERLPEVMNAEELRMLKDDTTEALAPQTVVKGPHSLFCFAGRVVASELAAILHGLHGARSYLTIRNPMLGFQTGGTYQPGFDPVASHKSWRYTKQKKHEHAAKLMHLNDLPKVMSIASSAKQLELDVDLVKQLDELLGLRVCDAASKRKRTGRG